MSLVRVQVNKAVSPGPEMMKASSNRSNQPVNVDNEVVAQEEIVVEEEDEEDAKSVAKSKGSSAGRGRGSTRGRGSRATKPAAKGRRGRGGR